MFKQGHALQTKTSDAGASGDLRHILIPACELGLERYQEFRAAKPQWQPRLYVQPSGDDEVLDFCEWCRECMASSIKPPNAKPQLTVECSGLSKVAKPISLSVQKLNNHTRLPVVENIASFHTIHSPVVIKATQHYAKNGVILEEKSIAKPISPVKPAGREVSSGDDMEQRMKSNLGEDYFEHARIKGSNFQVIQATASDHATSSEDLSEDTMTPSQMEAVSFSDHAAGGAQGVKVPQYTGDIRLDEHVFVEDEDLFKYVLATRQIPYGHSFSNLDIAMQRRLHDYFKQSCPPCPHCNSNTYVKFRYFNNSGKSSLLQPRYSCRNPDTCLAIQEKTGKAGSRDFTLPKLKEADNSKPPMVFASHEQANGQRGRSARQPQMIALCGSKRSAHNLNPLSEMAERCAKLPNTTLSLQTMNGPGPVDVENLQIIEASKAKALQSVKHAEDSNSSSSTRTASDKKTAINVRCRAVESSENGRLVVQPISVQQIGSTFGEADAGSVDRQSKGGKIAELNICMYIDLSSAS